MRPKKPLFSTETSVTFQANISPQTFNAKVHSLISIHRSFGQYCLSYIVYNRSG